MSQLTWFKQLAVAALVGAALILAPARQVFAQAADGAMAPPGNGAASQLGAVPAPPDTSQVIVIDDGNAVSEVVLPPGEAADQADLDTTAPEFAPPLDNPPDPGAGFYNTEQGY